MEQAVIKNNLPENVLLSQSTQSPISAKKAAEFQFTQTINTLHITLFRLIMMIFITNFSLFFYKEMLLNRKLFLFFTLLLIKIEICTY